MNIGKEDHSLLQRLQTLQEKGVDIIAHIQNQFKKILHDAWSNNKMRFYTSESNIEWNSDCKPGGTGMLTLNNVSSEILQKEQDTLGMGTLTYITILRKNNRITTIYTMYRPYKESINAMGDSTVIKQWWLAMKNTKKNIIHTK